LAGNEDSAIVSPHDPENGRQAEATAGKLGCKEGIENPGLSGFRPFRFRYPALPA